MSESIRAKCITCGVQSTLNDRSVLIANGWDGLTLDGDITGFCPECLQEQHVESRDFKRQAAIAAMGVLMRDHNHPDRTAASAWDYAEALDQERIRREQ